MRCNIVARFSSQDTRSVCSWSSGPGLRKPMGCFICVFCPDGERFPVKQYRAAYAESSQTTRKLASRTVPLLAFEVGRAGPCLCDQPCTYLSSQLRFVGLCEAWGHSHSQGQGRALSCALLVSLPQGTTHIPSHPSPLRHKAPGPSRLGVLLL